MVLELEDHYTEDSRRLRVDTLILLRWIAILGQTVATVYVYYFLGFQFPISLCFIAIITSALMNLALRFGTSRAFRLGDNEAALLLGYDILELSALLYLTGGVVNCFSMLLLAPVLISAVSLPSKLTVVLGIFMVAAATLLTVDYLPLPWHTPGALYFPLQYRLGVWAALTLSAAFIGTYAARVSDEARLLAGALAATELVLEREQHLSQLDGLAAAAAHELGTPLATITVVSKELRKAAPTTAPGLEEDLILLNQEALRCRDILRKLTSLANADDNSVLNVLSLGALIAEAAEPMSDPDVEIEVVRQGPGKEPLCVRNPGILYGLGNLVENAADFAKTKVTISASWSTSSVRIVIEDDGPGFSPAILNRLGDPYLRGRSKERRTKSDQQSGLGLGLFIATTLLERSGATIETGNVEAPRTGARVIITWPRAAFERPATPPANAARAHA
jgi:two-component system sensor histidine kinase RegB